MLLYAPDKSQLEWRRWADFVWHSLQWVDKVNHLGSYTYKTILLSAEPQDFYHPFHIHGYRLIITDMGRLPESAINSRLKYLQERNVTRRPDSHNPPFKDTVSIPNEGYVITRFRANNPGCSHCIAMITDWRMMCLILTFINPGFWFVHCHLEWHLGSGMGLVLQVGEVDQMLKAPVTFPRCGDFKPSLHGKHWTERMPNRSIYLYTIVQFLQ